MKRILYYSSEDFGSNHTSVEALFNGYMREYFEIQVVYKGHKTHRTSDGHIVVNSKRKRSFLKEIGEYLSGKYDLIIVRNDFTVLGNVIKARREGFVPGKIGFQCTFLHSYRRLIQALMYNRSIPRKMIEYILNSKKEKSLLGQIDFLLPNSKQMNRVVNVYNKPYEYIYSSMDMALLPKEQFEKDATTVRFIYVGTVDKLREMEVVINAFGEMESDNWEFHIYTKNVEIAEKHKGLMSSNHDKIKVFDSLPRERLYEKMSCYDVGVSIIPVHDVYNVASPVKLSEYFACGLAVITTAIPEAVELYANNNAAFFVSFDQKSITEELDHIAGTSKERLSIMGENGFRVVNSKRNYEKNTLYLEKFLDSQ